MNICTLRLNLPWTFWLILLQPPQQHQSHECLQAYYAGSLTKTGIQKMLGAIVNAG